MSQNQTIKHLTPPPELANKILAVIHRLELRAIKVRFAVLFSLSLGSLTLSIYLATTLLKSFASNGFYDYLSLVMTDASVLQSFWRELLVSLAESLPAFTFAVFLSTVGIFVWSGAKTFKNASMLKTA